jgi:heat shock protein HslJ
MKRLHITCIGLLILAILITGCTSPPAQTPVSPASTTVPAPQTTATVKVTPPDTLTSTTWKLGWFDDTNGGWTKVAEGSTIMATFLNEGRVTGSGGCNGYSAEYQLGNESRIFFKRPEVPDHKCQAPMGVMSQESYYFTDLLDAETYSITNGQLLFFDKAGKKILQFDPS